MNKEITHHILLYGDPFTCKNKIISAKKKYNDHQWLNFQLSKSKLDQIRSEIGTESWDEKQKIIIIEDIPNRKQSREFIIDLFKECPIFSKLIIWDSNGHIQQNSDGTYDKSWSDFLKKIRLLPSIKIVNNSNKLKETFNGEEDAINFIRQQFRDKSKSIGTPESKIFLSIVGYDRGLLATDIDKMCIIAPKIITSQFIIENAFPTSKESILYKFANVLDTASSENAIYLMDRFLESGINQNVLAEIIMKRARWQLAVIYLWYAEKITWEQIIDRILLMSKYPSYIWHNPKTSLIHKKQESKIYQDILELQKYLQNNKGIPPKYFHKNDKTKEEIMKDFWARQIVDFVKMKIINNPQSSGLEKKIFYQNAINKYLFCFDKLCSIRYGENSSQNLQEMIIAITKTSVA